MIKANMRDGRTLTFDLSNASGLAEWRQAEADPLFQSAIRALSIHHDKTLHTLPEPARFRRLAYGADLVGLEGEPTGERIRVLADDIETSITVYYSSSPRVTRTDVRRVGRARFVPRGKPVPRAVIEE